MLSLTLSLGHTFNSRVRWVAEHFRITKKCRNDPARSGSQISTDFDQI